MESIISNDGVYQIEISDRSRIDQIQQPWLRIQAHRNLPFFLTWQWISNWLDSFHPDIRIVTASVGGEIVTIGLFTISQVRRKGFIQSVQCRLHQMGDQLMDQIWMEYNDFIAMEEHREAGVNACLKAIQQSCKDWDEIIVSMMAGPRGRKILETFSNCEILQTNQSYSCDLQEVRQNYPDYLSSLTANTRYQIRRSRRLYQQRYGEMRLEVAQTVHQALDFFHQAGNLHILRWKDSGYQNPAFVDFHVNLINKCFDRGTIDLIRILAGDRVVGVLYFHKVNENVFFYLQGLKYEDDSKFKPGLVSHAMASQYYLEQGKNTYDYMGGYSQYKAQLAQRKEDMITVCIQQPRLVFAIEKAGRKLKRMFRDPGKRKPAGDQ